MAKVNIEYDTETKVLTATLDGKSIPDLNYINFYGYEDMNDNDIWSMELGASDYSDPNLRIYTRLCAKKNSDDTVKSIAGVLANAMKRG